MQVLYDAFLTLHIISFVAAIGTTLVSLVAYKQFWKLYDMNQEQGRAAIDSFLKTRMLGMIGLFVAILAGLSMEFIVGFVHMHFLWLKIKMTMILLLFAVGFTVGRTATSKLMKFVSGDEHEKAAINITATKRNLETVLYLQLALFMVIIVMAAFRFS